MKTRYTTNDFNEFMYTLNDFQESCTMWSDENASCTWGMKVEISKNNYIIHIEIDEDKSKYKSK
tara:strand:+ start:257 stop:448 length:192 start_codon:yes stop_codon:yes gene_type:complete